MNRHPLLFWQPKANIIELFSHTPSGRISIIVLNYLIWAFFFYVSYLLVRQNPNTFWQLLIATLLAEIIEKVLKSKVFWRRPLFEKKQSTPMGLVDSWYQTGSFPSGHSIKSTFFLLFVFQYAIVSPSVFLLIVLPLLTFRVWAGFHYPVDIIGGLVIGFLIWLLVFNLTFPVPANLFIQSLFNLVFFIK